MMIGAGHVAAWLAPLHGGAQVDLDDAEGDTDRENADIDERQATHRWRIALLEGIEYGAVPHVHGVGGADDCDNDGDKAGSQHPRLEPPWAAREARSSRKPR